MNRLDVQILISELISSFFQTYFLSQLVKSEQPTNQNVFLIRQIARGRCLNKENLRFN